IIKHHLGDDILLAETAGIDTGNGKDIAGVELGEQVGDDLPCLVQLLRVGAGGVEQHVDAAALRCIRGGAAADKQGERSDQGCEYFFHDVWAPLRSAFWWRRSISRRSIHSGMNTSTS